jgi:transcriptional regulator with XRE-family HTH domain
MSRDATPDPYAQPLAFGQRVQILRTRRGMSRPVLAGLLGMSPSWLKQLETGQLKVPSLPTVLRIAEALRVRDLADLTGDQSTPVDLFIGPGHSRLAAVKAAVDSLALTGDREAPPAEHLQHRLAQAWTARHAAPNHREVVGGLLPDLIRDAQLAARQADSAVARRTAQAALAEVYVLAQFFVAYQPDSALLWRVAERGMVAAQESEDPHTIGVAAVLTAQAHRDAGHLDATDTVTMEALRHLEPHLADGPESVRAIHGSLQFEAAHTAARRGDTGTAWAWWDKSRKAAGKLGADYFHPVTSFGQAITGAHAVTIAVALRAGGESVRQSIAADATPIPSRPRLARHRIEEARGYQLDGQPEVALDTLDRAHTAAPETIRYNGYAKRIVLEETESRVPARRQRASELAVKLGLLAA